MATAQVTNQVSFDSAILEPDRRQGDPMFILPRSLHCLALAVPLLGSAGCVANPPPPNGALQLTATKKDCSFDREKMLALDLDAFDQGPEGHRAVSLQRPECMAALADLIADYRKLHPQVSQQFQSYLLYWHEGQLRASDGQYEAAAGLFEQARFSDRVPREARTMWNLYVDATTAFVRRDLAALTTARAAMAAVPPEDYRPAAGPLNLDVIDGLVRCFARSYREAYGVCRQAQPK